MNDKTPNSRKRKTKNPCSVCRMHPERCFCADIPTLETRTKLSLIIHYKELKRTTNTGMLAVHALKNSDCWVRGEKNRAPFSFAEVLDERYQPLILFPADNARQLNQGVSQNYLKPIQLIVSDGNWRQASKVIHRYPEIKMIPIVKISDQSSELVLRKEHVLDGLSTLEAIAEAYSVIEGPGIGEQLKSLYRQKARATLAGRGR